MIGNMKRVYFIRHGETLANRRHIHQGPDEALSEKGREQAAELAKWLKDKNIDTLVASPFVRARETAEIVEKELGIAHETISSVVEFRRPDYIYGKSHFSIGSILYVWNLFWHQNEPAWKDDGAENMFAVRNRILDAKRDIEALPGQNIAVVTHAIFMDMFAEMVCAERPLKVQEFIQGLIFAKKTSNTGLIEFSIDENAPNGTCKWWVKDRVNFK